MVDRGRSQSGAKIVCRNPKRPKKRKKVQKAKRQKRKKKKRRRRNKEFTFSFDVT